MAVDPNWGAETEANEPKKLPIGVRAAEMM